MKMPCRCQWHGFAIMIDIRARKPASRSSSISEARRTSPAANAMEVTNVLAMQTRKRFVGAFITDFFGVLVRLRPHEHTEKVRRFVAIWAISRFVAAYDLGCRAGDYSQMSDVRRD